MSNLNKPNYNNDYKNLPPFKGMVLQNFPFIEEDFDAITNYQLLCKVVEYLKSIMNNEIILENNMQLLQDYVDNYFDNLDVQEEINKKLDEMTEDGTLTEIISSYIQPRIDAQNSLIDEQNRRINSLSNMISSAISGTPSGTYATLSALQTADPDHSKIYVVLENGNWYYYNNTTSSWTSGGVYQSAGIGTDSVGLENLKNEVINDRFKYSSNNNLINSFGCLNNKSIRSSDGEILDDDRFFITNKILVPSNKKIRLYYSADFQNDTGSSYNCYKASIYSINNEYVESFNSINNYVNETENDVYIIFQFAVLSLLYLDRFKLLAFVCDIEDNIPREFMSSTEINNDNIYLNVKEKSLNNNLQKRLCGFPDVTFEFGTIRTATGLPDASTNRLRSKTYNWFKKGTKIIIDNDVNITVIKYNNNYEFLSGTGWYNQNYTFEEDTYARLVLRYNNDITIDNIDTLLSHYIFIGTEENIYNSLKERSLLLYQNKISYEGELIKPNKNGYYEKQNFTSLGQDSANYNEYVFIFNSGGNFKVHNLLTNETTVMFSLDQNNIIRPHCNACFFSNTKYDVNDKFPLLYVNAYNTTGLPKGTLYCHRIIYDENNNTYETSLIQTINIGFTDNEIWTISGDIRDYGNFVLDTDKNELYAFTLRGENTRFFKFNMPNFTTSQVTLEIDDILDYFDTDYEPYIQGCLYLNGMIYSLCGINNIVSNSSSLRVIDLIKKQEISKMSLSSIMEEPESIIFYNDLYIAGATNFYKFNF